MTCRAAKAVVAPATVDVIVPLAGTLVGTLARPDEAPQLGELVDRQELVGRLTMTSGTAPGGW
jgi:hypothetical protein